MVAWWVEAGLLGPMKLMNKDNAAAAAASASQACDRVKDVLQAGVKLMSLAGAIFCHKDDKKGQQDTLQFFFKSVIGYMVTFLDTSNTHYQSHCDAATILVLYQPLFIKFLELVRDKKELGKFTNIELNMYRPLQDTPTVTELCVLVLYAQSISQSYMQQVLGPEQEQKNVLDLGQLHAKVKAYCQTVISNPDLLLRPDPYKTGAMDGRQWRHPEAFYAVQKQIPALPHI